MEAERQAKIAGFLWNAGARVGVCGAEREKAIADQKGNHIPPLN